MGKRIHKIGDNTIEGERFVFHCPGCGFAHGIITPRWTWNGSYEFPTFNPSVLHLAGPGMQYRCHSWIKDGNIQFLDDCWHTLKNRTVELPDLAWMDELDDG